MFIKKLHDNDGNIMVINLNRIALMYPSPAGRYIEKKYDPVTGMEVSTGHSEQNYYVKCTTDGNKEVVLFGLDVSSGEFSVEKDLITKEKAERLINAIYSDGIMDIYQTGDV